MEDEVKMRKMDLDEYQRRAKVTDLGFDELTPGISEGESGRNAISQRFLEKILGLPGEAGEVADKFKKIIRDQAGEITAEDRDEIVKELGDVMWYVALTAEYLGVPLSEVGERNIAKLSSRRERGKIGGSGDNR